MTPELQTWIVERRLQGKDVREDVIVSIESHSCETCHVAAGMPCQTTADRALFTFRTYGIRTYGIHSGRWMTSPHRVAVIGDGGSK